MALVGVDNTTRHLCLTRTGFSTKYSWRKRPDAAELFINNLLLFVRSFVTFLQTTQILVAGSITTAGCSLDYEHAVQAVIFSFHFAPTVHLYFNCFSFCPYFVT